MRAPDANAAEEPGAGGWDRVREAGRGLGRSDRLDRQGHYAHWQTHLPYEEAALAPPSPEPGRTVTEKKHRKWPHNKFSHWGTVMVENVFFFVMKQTSDYLQVH